MVRDGALMYTDEWATFDIEWSTMEDGGKFNEMKVKRWKKGRFVDAISAISAIHTYLSSFLTLVLAHSRAIVPARLCTKTYDTYN